MPTTTANHRVRQAGPILGQINSNELTDILIIVVRYFGGIKLGTSGLIVAYKAAAAEAIAAATVIEKTVDETVTFLFEYPFMNDVMRVVKEEEPEILEQSYDMDCRMTSAHPSVHDAEVAGTVGEK